MKHGPIALIEEGLPVVSFVSEDEISRKAWLVILKNSQRHRKGAYIIVIGTQAAVNLI